MNKWLEEMGISGVFPEICQSAEWTLWGQSDGVAEFVLSEEQGCGRIKVTLLGQSTTFIVAEVCFRQDCRLYLKNIRGRVEILTCIQGSAELLAPSQPHGQRHIHKGDTLLTGDLCSTDIIRASLLIRAGEPFTSASYLVKTSSDPCCVGRIMQEIVAMNAQNHKRSKCAFQQILSLPPVQGVMHKASSKTLHTPIARFLFLESCLFEAVACMVDWPFGCSKGQNAQTILDDYEHQALRAVHDRMLADLSNPPTLSQVAREVGLNETKLKRGFKVMYGMPVYQYFKKVKLHKAMRLLRSTDATVREIAFQCGYSSQGKFSAAFRSEFGISPMQTRKINGSKVGMEQKNIRLGDTQM